MRLPSSPSTSALGTFSHWNTLALAVGASAAGCRADRGQAGLDLVLVVVAKVRQAGDHTVLAVLDAQFLVDAGFGLEVGVALQVTAFGRAIATLTVAVQQVVGVELVGSAPCTSGRCTDLSLQVSVSTWDTLSDGLQLSPTISWWSDAGPGSGACRETVRCSAKTEKIRADDVLLRLVLVRPATLPPALVVWCWRWGHRAWIRPTRCPGSALGRHRHATAGGSPWAVRSRSTVV